MLARSRAWLCLLALAAALGAGGPASATGPTVRVLLYEGQGPVQIAASGGTTAVGAGPDGLTADGDPTPEPLRIDGPVTLAGGRYRGCVVVRRSERGLAVVNEVALEHYVEGTVLREVYPGWNPAVLRAQAVLVRTYALHRMAQRRAEPFDLTVGTESQVYGGMDAEGPEAARAVAATRGEYLGWRGKPILAAYHSSSGGRTASAEEVWGRPVPYLVSLPVADEEDSPDAYWRIGVSPATLGRALRSLGLRAVGSVQEVRVLERSPSGRVRQLSIRGSDGSAELSGRALRAAVDALPSTLFEVRQGREEFEFVGSGRGHGVGMSQWGAQAMAERGAGYREIVARFYPGTSLRKMPAATEE